MSFLEALERFNRKERFFLVAYALGKPTFALDPEFAKALGEAAGVHVPADASAYMDYHLDWIHTAAFLNAPAFVEAPHYPNELQVNTGNQEDVDLVVAFQDGERVRIIMIEAKAETGWTNAQLASKVSRLRRIFGDSGDAVAGVTPTFVLTSPSESLGINTVNWPSWMTRSDGRPRWFKLPVPAERWRVIGCDEAGKPSRGRTHFKLVKAR